MKKEYILKKHILSDFFLRFCGLNKVVHLDVYNVLHGEIHWWISMSFDMLFEFYRPSLKWEKMPKARLQYFTVTCILKHVQQTYINYTFFLNRAYNLTI